MGIYACGLSHQIRVAYAKVDRMKQEIKFITFYKFYITAGVSFDTLAGYAGTISSVTRKSAESIGESLKTIMVE